MSERNAYEPAGVLVEWSVLGRVPQTTHIKYGIGIKVIHDVYQREVECCTLFIYSGRVKCPEIRAIQEIKCLCTMNLMEQHWCHPVGTWRGKLFRPRI